MVINNAGVVNGKPLLQLSETEIRRTLDVNLLSQFWILQEFLPAMVERNRGMIVTIASTMGFFSAVGLSDYCASKHAVIGFHNAARLEMRKAKADIDFVLICPNSIRTGMFSGMKQGLQWAIPILEPKDVATATVKAIKRRSAMVILPAQLSPFAKIVKSDILPLWLKDFSLNLGGASWGMDTFKGRIETSQTRL